MSQQLTVFGLSGIPEISPGNDLSILLVQAADAQQTPIQTGDVVIVSQKVVSKAEGRLVELRNVVPSPLAQELASAGQHDPRHIEVVLREAKRIVRSAHGILITETRHGFRCANSGVDASNVPGEDIVALLPEDPDASADSIRTGIRRLTSTNVAVIISDTFGRPWREGAINVAIGVAGLAPLRDYRGHKDMNGQILRTTVIAVADEIAAAAELVTGKLAGTPAAVLRGYPYEPYHGSVQDLIRDASTDLFR